MIEWLDIGTVFGLLAIIMGGLKLFQKNMSIHPEISRKLTHISMGFITLSFPWVFKDSISVTVLAGISVALFLSILYIPFLNQKLGSILGAVERKSLGEVYFPISVAILFSLSFHSPVLYIIPILILTLADAFSALIGIRYGLSQYTTSDSHKSIEGSVTFFTIAFLSTHIPLLLMTGTGRLESLLIGTMMGILLMMLEAASVKGMDNLLVPVGAYIMLETYVGMGSSDLSLRLVILLLLLVLTWMYRNKVALKESVILIASFILYVIWVLGGLVWLVAPVIVFFLHPLFCPETTKSEMGEQSRIFGLNALFFISMAGLIWLFLNVIEGGSKLIDIRYLYCYHIAFALHLAIIGLTSFRAFTENGPCIKAKTKIIIGSWALLSSSFLTNLFFMKQLTSQYFLNTLMILPLTIVGFIIFDYVKQQVSDEIGRKMGWSFRGVFVLLVSVIGILFF